MYTFLFFVIVGLVAAALFVNIYFRVKVMRLYGKLVKNNVEFTISDLFNKKVVEEEVVPRYPHMADDIRQFTSHIKKSVYIAATIVILITILGAVIKQYS